MYDGNNCSLKAVSLNSVICLFWQIVLGFVVCLTVTLAQTCFHLTTIGSNRNIFLPVEKDRFLF